MPAPTKLVRFENVAGRDLCWSRPSFWSRMWELRAGTDVAARWRHERWWSSRAHAETVAESWTLVQTGFFRRGARATDEHGRIVAAYQPRGLRGGTVRLAHGQRLRLETDGLIGATSSLFNEQLLVLARFRPERGEGLRLVIRVELIPVVAQPELPLLLVLVGYLLVMRARDRAAAAASG